MSDINHALRRQKFSKRNAVFLILAAVAVFGWPYLLLTSDAFTINTVEARGLKALDPVEVTREVFQVLDTREGWRPWPARHAWFVDENKIEQQLKERLFVANVTVDKNYNNILRLIIEERSKKVIYHSRQQYYWVDIQGVATQALTDDERKYAQARLLGQKLASSDDAPIIKTNLDYEIQTGMVLADARRAKEWIKLSEDLKSYKLLYREIEPPTTSSTLFKVLSHEGYDVLMDITAPIDLQVKTYQGFIKSKPSDSKPLEYVDVRVPGRIYLKER